MNSGSRGPFVHQALRLFSACALSGASAWLCGVAEWYWALITAIVVMQPDLSHTWVAGRDRIMATLLGAAVGLLLIFLRVQGLPDLLLFAAGLAPLLVITAYYSSLRMSGVTLIVVYLIPADGAPYGRPMFRVLDILLGVVACLVVSLLIFRREPITDLKA